MLKQIKPILLACALLLSLLTSCAPQRVTVYCEPHFAKIYIDGKYQGNGIVQYSIPKSQKYIVVSCTEDDMRFISRKFLVHGLKSEISVYMDEYTDYSSSPKTLLPY